MWQRSSPVQHCSPPPRRLITAEDRGEILQKLESTNYQITAGGSLSNTLMALARLGAAGQPGADGIHVAMAGLVGSDPLGSFYSAQMQGAGVSVVSDPVEGASTGTVVVLTSPDAQRTMLSYLGTPAEIKIDARLEEAISRSTLLVIEGYLWELPRAAETISAAIAVAQRHGAMVAMTAGDAGVVERHHSEMWAAIDAGIDLLFTNADEATALVQHSPEGSAAVQASAPGQSPAEAAALALGPHCSLVCVTDGSAGSVLTALGEVYVVPPHWTSTPPVDTCGAGDAYAAGLLYGFLRRYDVVTMGRTAARTASAVIAHHGSTLNEEDAAAVVGGLPSAARSMTAPAPATAEVEAKGVA